MQITRFCNCINPSYINWSMSMLDHETVRLEPAVVIYEQNSRKRVGFLRSLVYMASNIFRSRELIKQLFVRDYLAAYKKSFLGITWIAISPILGIASWLFMNAAGILRPGDTVVPYPVYVLLGITIWGLFMGFYQSATATLTA